MLPITDHEIESSTSWNLRLDEYHTASGPESGLSCFAIVPGFRWSKQLSGRPATGLALLRDLSRRRNRNCSRASAFRGNRLPPGTTQKPR